MADEMEKKTPEALAQQLQSMLDEQWTPDGTGASPNPADAQPAEMPKPAENPRPENVGKKKSNSPRDGMLLFHDIVYILAAVVLIFTLFVRVSRVEGNSMYPTLVNHDQMLLLSSVWYQEPQRGDIVVARVQGFSADPIVKRVIALAGDTVDIDFDNGIVYVNGEALEEDYINELTTRQFYEKGISFPVTIEEDHVFLMGDNRNDSYDSRYASIGQVDQRCILGKVLVIVTPGWDEETDSRDFSRIGFVQ